MRRALFVFAHQDDELAFLSRIRYEVARGTSVECAFLTDGGAGRATPASRDAESRAVLLRAGVTEPRIHFLGSAARIPDGNLAEHLNQALDLLQSKVRNDFDDVYSLSWEGGHQDHDAALLIAAAFARARGAACWEMPLYNGKGVPLTLFRVLSPIGEGWETRRISALEGSRCAMVCRHYRSQRRTWLGLFPETFFKLAVRRREYVRRLDPSRLRHRPHEGPLLYERRFRYPYSRLSAAAEAFLDTHLA
ncbi:MAG TPA: PIG-L family deacetylase [Thermoanaerobaculia bacterium]|nr:PIG-L family deacetylase [Thermoanaerobaculia bacterium]